MATMTSIACLLTLICGLWQIAAGITCNCWHSAHLYPDDRPKAARLHQSHPVKSDWLLAVQDHFFAEYPKISQAQKDKFLADVAAATPKCDTTCSMDVNDDTWKALKKLQFDDNNNTALPEDSVPACVTAIAYVEGTQETSLPVQIDVNYTGCAILPPKEHRQIEGIYPCRNKSGVIHGWHKFCIWNVSAQDEKKQLTTKATTTTGSQRTGSTPTTTSGGSEGTSPTVGISDPTTATMSETSMNATVATTTNGSETAKNPLAVMAVSMLLLLIIAAKTSLPTDIKPN